jgi:hypothetical protein
MTFFESIWAPGKHKTISAPSGRLVYSDLELFEYGEPESFESPHYYPFKIQSPKRSCELVTVGPEIVVARLKESLIPADRQPSTLDIVFSIVVAIL